MTTVIVDRRTWGRGQGVGTGVLTDRNRKNRCCLGFLCNQVYGVPWNDMRGIAMPGSLSMFIDYPLSASGINDNASLTDQQRERALIEAFEGEGITLEFIN